jgi:hypothetical protein
VEFRATSTGADLDKLTGQAAKALTGVQRTLGREIAKVARRAILDDVKAHRPGGLRFSGMNTRLGASTKITPGSQLSVLVSAKPPGPWSIVEHGSRAHEIAPRAKRALYFNNLWSDSAYHPGTVGRPLWASSEAALDDAVTPVIVEAFEDALEGAA